MTAARLALIVLVLSPLLPACIPMGCTQEARAGVSVGVVDAASAQPITNATITLRSRDGAEQVLDADDAFGGRYVGAWEMSGVYDVEVSAPGYATKRLGKVRIDEDSCHVETRSLDVTLELEVSA